MRHVSAVVSSAWLRFGGEDCVMEVEGRSNLVDSNGDIVSLSKDGCGNLQVTNCIPTRGTRIQPHQSLIKVPYWTPTISVTQLTRTNGNARDERQPIIIFLRNLLLAPLWHHLNEHRFYELPSHPPMASGLMACLVCFHEDTTELRSARSGPVRSRASNLERFRPTGYPCRM